MRDDLGMLVRDMKAVGSPFRQYLNRLYERHRGNTEGAVATYIPELARANPQWFGVAAMTVDGQQFGVGDSQQPFTIQSVSKPFVFGQALSEHGRAKVAQRVGVEPLGEAFNSYIKLDANSKRPHNPMVNAGAIATAGLITGADPTLRLRKLLTMFEAFAGHPLNVDVGVFVSEKTTGHRNRAIAHLMLNFGMIEPDIDQTLDLYFQQCSVLVTAQDLAAMAATLANHGVNPVTGVRAIPEDYIRDVLSVMYTCGMYDYAGEWAYTVGLPAKSGVSGGVIAVVPGKLGIAVFSPLLDVKGNSVRGIKVCEDMSADLGLHTFAPTSKLDELLGK
ncbi:MAG TPA: glutaminase A [Tepidisphaeraceae bacterium]|nr:glutaminase A [Tepidisphaeraceae bacterium]